MDLPDGMTRRPATIEDAEAITALANEVEEVDLGVPMLMLSDVQADLASPSLDLAADTVLVFDGEALVASGQVADERADVDVHPRYRGRGIGTTLIEWSEGRARVQAGPPPAPVRIGQTVPAGATGARELFEARGYAAAWDSWVLRLPEGVEPNRPGPAGTEIRPYRRGEERTVHGIIDRAFSEWEGRDPKPFEDWEAHVLQRPDFDPTLLLVALVDGEPLGAAYGINYPGEGWVDQVAVEPAARGRGIATALLAALFREFRDRGETILGLNTDSRTGALDLYLNLGMVVEHTYTRWARELDR